MSIMVILTIFTSLKYAHSRITSYIHSFLTLYDFKVLNFPIYSWLCELLLWAFCISLEYLCSQFTNYLN